MDRKVEAKIKQDDDYGISDIQVLAINAFTTEKGIPYKNLLEVLEIPKKIKDLTRSEATSVIRYGNLLCKLNNKLETIKMDKIVKDMELFLENDGISKEERDEFKWMIMVSARLMDTIKRVEKLEGQLQ